jgi:predicted TIM-barrel fold metal-dependent hydrolase
MEAGRIMKITDCHANIGWDTNNIRKNYFPTEQKYQELLIKMNKNDISKAIILPFPSPAGQFSKNTFWYEMENHYLMQASKYSDRFIPFPAVNPNDDKSVNNIKTLAIAFDIRGIKISHQIPMGFSIDKLIGHELMKIVKENNLVVMIHTGTGKEAGSRDVHETLNYGIKVAKKYPDIKFIFCHLGRLHKSVIEAIKIKNIYMDTSAISMANFSKEFIALEPFPYFINTRPELIIKKLVDFGYEDKIIFGSDQPYVSYKDEIASINNAEIPEKAKRKIFHENISKLIGLNQSEENEYNKIKNL